MSTETTRRDFIYIADTGSAIVGLNVSAWPFVESFNPSADTFAAGTTEVDVTSLQQGERLTEGGRELPCRI